MKRVGFRRGSPILLTWVFIKKKAVNKWRIKETIFEVQIGMYTNKESWYSTNGEGVPNLHFECREKIQKKTHTPIYS